MFFIKPTSDAVTVRDPDTGRPLDAAGEVKHKTAYWLRRLRDGDVQIATPPKAAKSTSSKGDA